MPNDKITAVGANIAEKAAMIWNVADMLRGPFKPHEYGLVILPMTVVKRFHDCLLPTHQAVLDTYEKVKKLQVIDGFLQKASGYQFYNTSRFTFETLLADPDNIESNFRDYLSGFSANAQDVLAKFDFDNIIKRMVESNTLYLVIKEFGSEKGYLGPDKISAVDCGYIFEDLVRRFSESFGEEAGAHFTSRDIIYLMTDLLLSEADLDTSSMTVYDMAMGTSQMLSCMEERIPNATFAGFLIRVRPFSDRLYTPYAKYYFRSTHLRFYLVKEMNLVTRASLGQSLLKSMPVLLPPLEEQKEIANYLDAKCAEIDRLIAKKEQLVKELESYKKGLIYEVVTGKREV